MPADKVYRISTSPSFSKSGSYAVEELTWPALVKRLTTVKEGPKGGSCWIPGQLNGSQALNEAVEEIGVFVLDVDNGTPTDELVEAVRKAGLCACVTPSYSYGTRRTTISEKLVESWRKKHPGKSDADLLRSIKKHRPEVLEGAHETGRGEKGVTFTHAPCPKHRVALPMAEPFTGTAAEWKATRRAVEKLLDITGDRACDNPARLYFWPRKPEGARRPRPVIVDGDLLDLSELTIEPEAHPDRPSGSTGKGAGGQFMEMVADLYVAHVESLSGIAMRHGYTDVGGPLKGACRARLKSPASTSGKAGFVVLQSDDGRERCFSHHGSDEDLDMATGMDALDLLGRLEYPEEWRLDIERRRLALRYACNTLLGHAKAVFEYFGEANATEAEEAWKLVKSLGHPGVLDVMANHAWDRNHNTFVRLGTGQEEGQLSVAHSADMTKYAFHENYAPDPGKLMVDGQLWWPGRPLIFEHEGRRVVNTFRLPPRLDQAWPVSGAECWLDLLQHLIPEKEYQDYALDWFAHLVQRPGVKMSNQILLGGEPGAGKDSLLEPLMRAFGSLSGSVEQKHIRSDYDDHFAKKLLVSLQEVTDRSKVLENALKNHAAAPPEWLHLNIKGGARISQPNVLNWFATTNARVPLNLDPEDRRVFAYWTETTRKSFGTAEQYEQYFRRYYRWLSSGGVEEVLGFLQARKIQHTFRNAPPLTGWKEELGGLSGGRLATAIRTMVEERTPPFNLDLIRLRDLAELAPDAFAGESDQVLAESLQEAGIRPLPLQVVVKVNGTSRKVRLHVVRDRNWAQYKPRAIWDAYWSKRLTQRPLPPQQYLEDIGLVSGEREYRTLDAKAKAGGMPRLWSVRKSAVDDFEVLD